MKLLLLLLLSIFPVVYAAYPDDLMLKTDETRYCFGLDVNPTEEMVACMKMLTGKKEKQYNQAYSDLIKKLKEEKKQRGFNNFNEFLQKLAETKKSFEIYMDSECQEQALVQIKNSWDYSVTYDHCLVTLYNQRIDFYKNYQY